MQKGEHQFNGLEKHFKGVRSSAQDWHEITEAAVKIRIFLKTTEKSELQNMLIIIIKSQ